MATDRTYSELIESGRVLIADGGMGTLLLGRGLDHGECPELLNVDQPELIAGIHRDYVAAGADIILTNTFGGTASRLGHFELENRVTELNMAGATIALEVAAAAGRSVAVGGSIGPSGELLAPLGPLEPERAADLFGEQASALAAAGVDVLWIETMSLIAEVEVAYKAAAATGLPVAVTMSFDTHGRTMMGVWPSEMGEWAAGQQTAPVAIGANCGIGPDDVVAAVAALSPTGIPTIAKANCGMPQWLAGDLSYPVQPGDMQHYADAAVAAGARIVGACCGSEPAHIKAIRAAIT